MVNLTRLQNLGLRMFGHVSVGKKALPNGKEIEFFAFRCPTHGLVENYASGYGKSLLCSACLKELSGNHVPQERRTKQELRADILRVALNGAGKTELVYGAYLNFDIIKGHLAELMRTGRIEQRGKRFYTTEAGLKYISYVEAIE